MPLAAASPRRLATALAASTALAALSGCTGGTGIAPCPGVEVAVLELVATRASASCQGDTAPADGDDACRDGLLDPADWQGRCQLDRPVPACCFDRLFRPVIPAPSANPADPPPDPLTVSIAYGAQGSSAALCLPRPGTEPYLGTRTPVPGGEALSVTLDTAGAVLASCSAVCAVTVHHQVTGLLARDAVSGAVTGFSGEHVETASATPSADCAPCAAPCTATWTLGSVP